MQHSEQSEYSRGGIVSIVYFSFRVVLEEEAGVATAWVEEIGVDTDCVVVVAVVITGCGAVVDTAETTMEGTAGGLVGAGLNGPKEDWEVLVTC